MKRNRGGEKGKLNVVTCFLRVLCSSCPHPKSRMIKVIELFYSKQKRLDSSSGERRWLTEDSTTACKITNDIQGVKCSSFVLTVSQYKKNGEWCEIFKWQIQNKALWVFPQNRAKLWNWWAQDLIDTKFYVGSRNKLIEQKSMRTC